MFRSPHTAHYAEIGVFAAAVLAFVGGLAALMVATKEDPIAATDGTGRTYVDPLSSSSLEDRDPRFDENWTPPPLPGLREGESLYHGRWTSEWTAELETGEPADQLLAIDALKAIGPTDPAVTPALLSALESPMPLLRSAAAQALSTGEAEAPLFLDDLIAALDDDDASVRFSAARSLGNLGPAAAPAAPALAAWLELDSEPAQIQAIEALTEIGPGAAPAIPAVVAILREGEGSLASRSIGLLGAIGPEAAPYAPDAVLAAVTHQVSDARLLTAMLSIGPDAADELAALLVHEEPNVRKRAANSVIALVDFAAEEAREIAIATLSRSPFSRSFDSTEPSEEEQAEMEAADGLVDELLAKLVPWLADDDPSVRRPVAQCLARTFDERHAGHVTVLARALESEDTYEIARSLARAATRLGPAAAPAEDGLWSAFYRDVEEGGAYMQALVAIGEPAVDRLLLALHDVDDAVVGWARGTLDSLEVDVDAVARERRAAAGMEATEADEQESSPIEDEGRSADER